MSRQFYDDEILFVDDNGDIHLKEGVKRLNYPTLSPDYMNHINLWEKAMTKIETFKYNNRDWDND